jgi:hypothetical protein
MNAKDFIRLGVPLGEATRRDGFRQQIHSARTRQCLMTRRGSLVPVVLFYYLVELCSNPGSVWNEVEPGQVIVNLAQMPGFIFLQSQLVRGKLRQTGEVLSGQFLNSFYRVFIAFIN